VATHSNPSSSRRPGARGASNASAHGRELASIEVDLADLAVANLRSKPRDFKATVLTNDALDGALEVDPTIRAGGVCAEMSVMTRAAATYAWPETLRLPARPPKLVYLDLNHWVSLAKAHTGHREGEQFKDALAACIDAVDRGVAVFPVSDSIYIEVSKIGQYRQRRDLRDVIERVSGYRVVTSRVVVAEHEVEGLLDRLVGPSPDPINAMDYLDWGVARAFGKVGGFRIKSKDTDEDMTDEDRSRHPEGPEAFDRKLARAELELNRKTLDGPTAEEEPQMRSTGWDPMAAFEVALRRTTQEMEQVERFNADPSWRRGRIRDVIAAREVIIEINDMLWRGLSARGTELEAAFPEPEETLRAFDSMPSFDVSVSLKTAFHRDPSHRWKPNDIQDIDALSSTVPYCDIVVTDKEAASHLVRTGVADRLQTTALSSISDLARHV